MAVPRVVDDCRQHGRGRQAKKVPESAVASGRGGSPLRGVKRFIPDAAAQGALYVQVKGRDDETHDRSSPGNVEAIQGLLRTSVKTVTPKQIGCRHAKTDFWADSRYRTVSVPLCAGVAGRRA
jgi:hypothetical protein